jgi:hypothetical protein
MNSRLAESAHVVRDRTIADKLNRQSMSSSELDSYVRSAAVALVRESAERGRCLYAGVFSFGGGYEFRQSQSDARAGRDRDRARKAGFHPLRQRTRVHQSAFSGVGYGKEDRGRAYSAGEADAECAGGELSRTAARRVFERELVLEPVRCQAQDRGLENGVQRRASAQQLRLSHAEGVCSARNNELWKRRLPKIGRLGKR